MKKSHFTGSAWEIFGWTLLFSLSQFLFFIPHLFLYPQYLKWFWSKVTIDDSKIEFTYSSLWFGFIGWNLFSVFTLGFGYFYAQKKIRQFEFEHLKVIDYSRKNIESEQFDVSSWKRNDVSTFDGSAWGILGYEVISFVSISLYLIPFAWAIVSIQKWYSKHSVISGKRLTFDYQGPYFGFFGWFFLTIVTFGLGVFYMNKKLIQWSIEHTHFDIVT